MKPALPLLLAAAICSSLSAQEQSPAPSQSFSNSQAAASPAAPDGAELANLLHQFLAGASRNDPAMHDRFWADDLIYTSSSGRRMGKAEIMRDVRTEAAAPAKSDESATYSAEDIRIQQYGATAIVAFRLVGTTRKGDATETANYLNTGTFLKRDGQWQAVSWQATKIPANQPNK